MITDFGGEIETSHVYLTDDGVLLCVTPGSCVYFTELEVIDGQLADFAVDGNDIAALVTAFDEIAEHRGSPSVVICDTSIGYGVPLLMEREKAHFMRVEEHEWQIAHTQLEEGTSR